MPGSETEACGIEVIHPNHPRGGFHFALFDFDGTLSLIRDGCAALGLSGYFDGGIYGALDDYRRFSKKMIIERIYREHGLHGPELLAFGGGSVEDENTKGGQGGGVGGGRDGGGGVHVDPWKRSRLIQAGADLIIPHFRQHQAILGYLFAEGC